MSCSYWRVRSASGTENRKHKIKHKCDDTHTQGVPAFKPVRFLSPWRSLVVVHLLTKATPAAAPEARFGYPCLAHAIVPACGRRHLIWLSAIRRATRLCSLKSIASSRRDGTRQRQADFDQGSGGFLGCRKRIRWRPNRAHVIDETSRQPALLL